MIIEHKHYTIRIGPERQTGTVRVYVARTTEPKQGAGIQLESSEAMIVANALKEYANDIRNQK